MSRRAAHGPGGDLGQDLIEYAYTMPLFLLLVLGIMEFGYLFFQYSTITNAAREAARAGIVPVTCDLACVRGVARHFTDAAGLDPADLTITATNPTAGQVRVVITYTRGSSHAS